MAAIGSNPLIPGMSNLGATTNANAAVGDAQSASNDSGTFMQLVEGMIQGGTSGDQLPANLAAFLLTGDAGSIEGVTTDTTDSDSDDTDEEALATLAALLPGLQTFAPMPAANAGAPANDGSTTAIGATSAQGALETLLDTSQAAITDAMDDALAATDAAQGPEGADAANPPTNPSAHAASMLQAHKAAEAAPQAASAEVRTPVGAPGWSDEIGTHLTMMAANGREAASLRLSPEHLGPLEVKISMKDGEASVVFNASNADTRSALEQSLPRLREMFASQGLVLGDANVSRDNSRDSFKPATFSRAGSSSDEIADVTPVTLSKLGLVDTFA